MTTYTYCGQFSKLGCLAGGMLKNLSFRQEKIFVIIKPSFPGNNILGAVHYSQVSWRKCDFSLDLWKQAWGWGGCGSQFPQRSAWTWEYLHAGPTSEPTRWVGTTLRIRPAGTWALPPAHTTGKQEDRSLPGPVSPRQKSQSRRPSSLPKLLWSIPSCGQERRGPATASLGLRPSSALPGRPNAVVEGRGFPRPSPALRPAQRRPKRDHWPWTRYLGAFVFPFSTVFLKRW